MSAKAQIKDFAYGEEVVIEFSARDRDGAVLPDAVNTTCSMVIATSRRAASNLLEFDQAPEVVLADASDAKWIITLDHTDNLSSLTAGRTYYYAIWTTDAGGDSQLQAEGDFLLPNVVRPT